MPDKREAWLYKALPGAVRNLREALAGSGVNVKASGLLLTFTSGGDKLLVRLSGAAEATPQSAGELQFPADFFIGSPHKLAGLVLTKLHLNKRIFARNCETRVLKKETAREFLDEFHLMGWAGSAYCLGLYDGENLLCVASFSKGRKMRRLKENERSYELIRFCTRTGYTVTGGLSKLMQAFCDLKKAAEVMTYVDKHFSDGRSFLKAGFVKIGETPPQYFLVDRKNLERQNREADKPYDKNSFFEVRNQGNIKMIFTCKK